MIYGCSQPRELWFNHVQCMCAGGRIVYSMYMSILLCLCVHIKYTGIVYMYDIANWIWTAPAKRSYKATQGSLCI